MDWSQDEDPHGVRKLLSMLRTQQDVPAKTTSLSATGTGSGGSSSSGASGSGVAVDRYEPKSEDMRYISFAQALPHLTRLSRDEAFLSALLRLKDEQDGYEKQLADERAEFSKRKGGGLDRQAALASWDREALRRWDSLHRAQQQHLHAWRVPCFFETADPGHLKKQEQVFDVLYALLEQ